MKKSSSVGVRPILVLSYKNHAIDEFLVDLVKTERGLSSNKMIRIGGQCQDPRLKTYSERSAYDLNAEVTLARSQVENLNVLKGSIEATVDGNLSSFMAYFDQVFQEEDAQARKKSVNAATATLMECIAKRHLLLSANKRGEKTNESAEYKSSIFDELKFLELADSGKTASRKVLAIVNNWDGSLLITAMLRDVSHYGQEHWGDVLLRWLTGKNPLPPCKFMISPDEKCNELSLSSDCALCHKHRCSFSGIDDGQCKSPCNGNASTFCDGHCCHAPNCTRSRIPVIGQPFCHIHSCRRCLEVEVVSEIATDPPPYNVCEKHPLCMFPNCTYYPLSEGNYCRDHSIVCCMGTTKKGKPCKGQVRSRMMPYCTNHAFLAGKMFSNAENVSNEGKIVNSGCSLVSKRCPYMKKKGGQCKAYCANNASYCTDHQDDLGVETLQQNKATGGVQNVVLSTSLIKASAIDQKPIANDSLVHTKPSNVCDRNDNIDESASVLSSEYHSVAEAAGDADFVEEDGLELEEEEGENLRHMRDVFEVDDEDMNELSSIASDSKEVHVTHAIDELQTKEQFPGSCHEPKEWMWDWPLEKRWEACQALMNHLHILLSEKTMPAVKSAIIVARKDLVQSKIRAKAKAYENKSIIGGTMVGCITRLESIQKTRPFAVVVEEASEVLEPLLFSCLSESTMKLEMIGDHRQLQPSVMSRYDFEVFNKVNISMFQRLIEAPDGHQVPSTVLSVQRRMRKNICDLTRDFYADITQIEDHTSCNTQIIGGRITHQNSIVRASATGGREIPGVMPHLFLWTHTGAQQRSRVGISRINPQEAKMSCHLAAYLVECGVPRSSIVIITPYKGQLIEIRSLLQSNPLSSKKLLSRDPEEKDVCRVSTIDRFQVKIHNLRQFAFADPP